MRFYKNALAVIVRARSKNRVENALKCQQHLASLSTRSSIRKRAFPLLDVGESHLFLTLSRRVYSEVHECGAPSRRDSSHFLCESVSHAARKEVSSLLR